MKNKFNRGRYSQDYISPTLEKLFLHFKNLKSYLKSFNCFVNAHKKYTELKINEIKGLPLEDQKELLSNLNIFTDETFEIVISICEECEAYYFLTNHQKKIIKYSRDEITRIASNVYDLFWDVTEVDWDPNIWENNELVSDALEKISFAKNLKEMLFMPIRFN